MARADPTRAGLTVRCAIYTRKSSDEGLEQEFNSLDAQREARELARRLQGTGVTANCLHPGFVATRIGDESGGSISRFAWLAKLFALSPEMGTDTIIYLASSPAVAETTGEYFYKRQPIAPLPTAQDDRVAALLWERSADLAGLNA